MASAGGAGDWNAKVIAEFRSNGGRVGGPYAGATIILVHHIGARTGIERVTPLGCFPRDDGGIAIVASNGGAPSHPDWYHNLRAHPDIVVELGTETFAVRVEELTAAARAGLWPALVAQHPPLAHFQAQAARRIPVLMLRRRG